MLELEEKNIPPLFECLPSDAIKVFRRKTNDKTCFPIILDLNYIRDKGIGHTNPFH